MAKFDAWGGAWATAWLEAWFPDEPVVVTGNVVQITGFVTASSINGTVKTNIIIGQVK